MQRSRTQNPKKAVKVKTKVAAWRPSGKPTTSNDKKKLTEDLSDEKLFANFKERLDGASPIKKTEPSPENKELIERKNKSLKELGVDVEIKDTFLEDELI